MHRFSALAGTFLPLVVGLVALFLLAWRCDRVARRVAPDLVSRPYTLEKPVGFRGWVRFVVDRVGATVLVIAFIAGSPIVAYAALAILSLGLAYYGYTLRIRPLILKGASRHETLALLSLMILAVVSLGWFLGRFAGRARGVG